uniref:NXPE C-terminal domain-containing protein n=2 Tax=Leptobrachium leishanense TaxID=445787 RepID=A0A8C5QJZ4_9ANUR
MGLQNRCQSTCKMFTFEHTSFKKSLLMLVIVVLLISFTYYKKLFKPLNYSKHNAKPTAIMEYNSNYRLKEDDLAIREIFSYINQSVCNAPFIWINKTTSGLEGRAILLNHMEKHYVGDDLIVQVDMFDYLGEKKTYGGDFLRARIYSKKFGAGASGRIEDFNNGSYNIHFTLSWEGSVSISIILIHPSEGVSLLWKARNMGYEHIQFTGKFLSNSQEIHRECGFYLESKEEMCEYADKKHDEFFYCIKPPNVPCEALISLMSSNKPHSYLSVMENNIFNRSNIGVKVPINIGTITVLKPQEERAEVMTKCRTGLSPPFPSGYFFQNVWHSLFCNLSSYGPLSQINTCLSGKIIYLMGDSTLRQWIQYFPKLLKNLKFFDLHGRGWHKRYLALDMDNNIFIQWKRHGHPFVTNGFYNMKEYSTITNEIDRLSGDPYTIIVIGLGHHFRAFPLTVFIRRVLNIKKAVERILIRSPDTKIIIKSENTRELGVEPERFSEFHGYIQYNLVKDIFKGLNIGIIDAWDMTIAFGSNSAHPSETIIRNEINMFLAYIC